LAGNTGTDSTTLISNLSAFGMLAQLDMRVDTATDHLNIAAAFTVENMDFDVDFLGIGIRGMSIKGAGTNFDYAAYGIDVAALPPQQQAVLMGFANVNLDVYKGAGLGASTAVDVLRIDVNNVFMDVNIAAVVIGGASIGSLAIDNLAVTNTKLAVYGH
ncbi:MAG TPA: hypothetical protein VL091_06440, partial [Marinobacter sp.]|nr:hypothetical protein [Marinobacter sp.]